MRPAQIILAPMSGVTDRPFRDIVRRYGGPDLVISEMIASQAMVRQIRKSLQRSCQIGEEGPIAVQLAGCDPEVMAEAARLNVDRGATLIDINMGCPVKKIAINSYAGAALMRDEDLAQRIFESVTKAVPVPVTVKMRKGWDDNSLNAGKLAQLAEKAGLKGIAIHARTRCQLYQGKADWPFIATVKKAVSIPVVGNGDILSVQDAKTVLDVTGADGIMIGRGCYGRPWFLKQIRIFLETGSVAPPPPLQEQKEIIEEHLDGIFRHYGYETGIGFARKHLAWYSKGLENAAEFRIKVFGETDAALMIAHMRQFYAQLIDTQK